MYPALIELEDYELRVFREEYPHGSLLDLERFIEAREQMKQIEIIPIGDKENKECRG